MKVMVRWIRVLGDTEIADEATEASLEIAKQFVWVDLEFLDTSDRLDFEVGGLTFETPAFDCETVGEPVTERIAQVVHVWLVGKLIRIPSRVHVDTDEGPKVDGVLIFPELASLEFAESFDGAANARTETE